MTLGQALLRRYDEVAPRFSQWPAGSPPRRGDRSSRQCRLHCIPRRERSARPASVPRLVQFAVDRLQGDWGEEVSTEAALALRDEARFHPERLAGHADGLVGGLVMEINSPAGSTAGLVVPGADPLSGIEALGRRQRRETRISCLEHAIGHLVEAGADDAVGALFSLLDTEDDGSADAVSVRASATRLLGKIGSRPVHLPAVVPRLYTGLLHANDKVGGPPFTAGRTWRASRSRSRRLCSTCCPPCLPTRHVAVSALRLIDRLDIPPERRPELLRN